MAADDLLLTSQSIKSHGIDLVLLEYSGQAPEEFTALKLHSSMLNNWLVCHVWLFWGGRPVEQCKAVPFLKVPCFLAVVYHLFCIVIYCVYTGKGLFRNHLCVWLFEETYKYVFVFHVKDRAHLSTFKIVIFDKFSCFIVLVVFLVIVQSSELISVWFCEKMTFKKKIISYHIFAIYVGGASLGVPTACRLIAVSGARLPSADGLAVRCIKNAPPC